MDSKKKIADTVFSVLDLVPNLEGKPHKEILEGTLKFAQHLDTLNFKRLWISEHHNTEGTLSSSTVVILGYLLGETSTIRIGSGGIMLPNHTPLVVAEQMGTLATLYPNRVDLGIGRAPGTDQVTAQAIRRQAADAVQDFPRDIQELHYFLSNRSKNGPVRAIPGEGTEVPIYLLGSSPYSAHLASGLGLPYAFASHFAPAHLFRALSIYKSDFQPSSHLKKPYTIAGVNIILADTDEEAQYLATSGRIFRRSIIKNERIPLQPPQKELQKAPHPFIEERAQEMSSYSFIGCPETVKKQLEIFIRDTEVDEVIVSSMIYDLEAKKHSFTLLDEIINKG